MRKAAPVLRCPASKTQVISSCREDEGTGTERIGGVKGRQGFVLKGELTGKRARLPFLLTQL